MSTATATDRAIGETRTLLRGVGWDGYQALLEWFGDDGPRMTCVSGNVEIMSPSPSHGHFDGLLAFLVDSLSEELGVPYEAFTPITLRGGVPTCGVEPDRSYYLRHLDLLSAVRDLDRDAIPPPDLCLEVEISHPPLPRLPIYAALGVPEVWRFDGESLTVFLVDDSGTHQVSPQSRALPGVPMTELEQFLRDYRVGDGLNWRRRFRAWVRDNLAPPGGG